jgi:hypothetical protein
LLSDFLTDKTESIKLAAVKKKEKRKTRDAVSNTRMQNTFQAFFVVGYKDDSDEEMAGESVIG